MIQGNVNFQSRIPPPAGGGPPFALNSADNGLSIDPVTGRIVLGQAVGAAGDPAQLLSAREIPLKGFNFTLGEAGDAHFLINPTARTYLLGDLNAGGFGSTLLIADASQSLSYSSGGGTYFRLNVGAGTYTMGDVSGLSNGAVININDTASLISLDIAFGSYVTLDAASDYYSFGDDFNMTNGGVLVINNGVGRIEMKSLVNGMIGSRVFDISDATSNCRIGDLDTNRNGLIFNVDDGAGRVEISNTAVNALVRINGVNGFTGTVTPVTSITVNGGIVTAVS